MTDSLDTPSPAGNTPSSTPRSSPSTPGAADVAARLERARRANPWRLDLGATVVEGGARFRVWAPNARRVEVEIARDGTPLRVALGSERDGYFAATVASARAGDRYRYHLDGGQGFPDPASRCQPAGPHGPSQVVDPSAYRWQDQGWPGVGPDGLVIYELHVGTSTPEGTFEALIPSLSELKALGVTALEVMPVAEFPGRRNWGYDGVDLYAPESAYGGPEGLRRLVDAAHQVGLGVLLDVVYNHFGPDGNYLRVYSADYFTDRHTTPWGDAINYDGSNSQHVRHFVLQNARYWLEEYHLDGLRLDATHAIVDTSRRHLLAEIAETVHSLPDRRAVVIAEDHRNLVEQIRPASRGGLGLDCVWADDFHHAIRTYLTGEYEGYYASYSGRLADVATTIEQGFLYQGQLDRRSGKPRGTRVTDEPARAFVFCLENHDQVGNRALGERLSHSIDRDRYLVASAVLLMAPETVLLFQGQEYAASAPFQYFTQHNAELGRLVTDGRRNEFKDFAAFADPARRARIPDPQAPATFERSRPDPHERVRNADVYALYRTLLALRRDDPVLQVQDRAMTRARALGRGLLAIRRWQGADERLLLANFADQTMRVRGPDLAKLGIDDAVGWRVTWTTPNGASSSGAAPVDLERVAVPGRAALLLSRSRRSSMGPSGAAPAP
ncbi:MAG: malto-oligosyltrehalose trehalohydrolase [Chloroflexi bacterium]|nr:malto-oligosyltrehalose trehalohydrolase [Chloroflexota bacterium]